MACSGRRETRRNPSCAHQDRVRLLEDLADLLGASRGTGSLGDRTRPDVFRLSVRGGMIFIGEAKHSEGPDDIPSLARIAGYLRWLRVGVSRPGVIGVFALCCPSKSAERWKAAIEMVAEDVHLDDVKCVESSFPRGDSVVSFALVDTACRWTDVRENAPSA